MDHLCSLPWKGNARELENVIERALALSESREIDVEDLPERSIGAPRAGSHDPRDLAPLAQTRMTLHELEDAYIEEVLKLTGGNKVKAANILGIDRKTLYRRRLGSSKRGS
jgi:DNA-binding NtrC family response regulator